MNQFEKEIIDKVTFLQNMCHTIDCNSCPLQMKKNLTGSSYVTKCFFELSDDKLPVYWEVDQLYEE